MAPLRIALFAALVAGGAALRAVALPGRVAGRAARAAPCMTATPPEGSKEDGNGGALIYALITHWPSLSAWGGVSVVGRWFTGGKSGRVGGGM